MNAADSQVHAELQRAVGQLEGTMAAVQSDVAGMNSKLDTVCAYIEREKGAKRALIATGSVAGGVVGAFFAAVVAWWTR